MLSSHIYRDERFDIESTGCWSISSNHMLWGCCVWKPRVFLLEWAKVCLVQRRWPCGQTHWMDVSNWKHLQVREDSQWIWTMCMGIWRSERNMHWICWRCAPRLFHTSEVAQQCVPATSIRTLAVQHTLQFEHMGNPTHAAHTKAVLWEPETLCSSRQTKLPVLVPPTHILWRQPKPAVDRHAQRHHPSKRERMVHSSSGYYHSTLSRLCHGPLWHVCNVFSLFSPSFHFTLFVLTVMHFDIWW